MDHTVPIEALDEAYELFRNAAAGVPEERFATPMSAGGWAVNATVAHLVGWNGEMVQAGRNILAGKTPDYYAERDIDYRVMNARFVAQYASWEKSALLAELASTYAGLHGFAAGLDPADMDAEHGVTHYRGGPATVARTLSSLAGDYRHHAEEITAWLAGRSR